MLSLGCGQPTVRLIQRRRGETSPVVKQDSPT